MLHNETMPDTYITITSGCVLAENGRLFFWPDVRYIITDILLLSTRPRHTESLV